MKVAVLLLLMNNCGAPSKRACPFSRAAHPNNFTLHFLLVPESYTNHDTLAYPSNMERVCDLARKAHNFGLLNHDALHTMRK